MVQAALDVAFDAAVRIGVTRILSEPRPDPTPDPIATLLGGLLPRSVRPATAMLAAAWRCALLAVADRTPPAAAKAGMRWVLNVQSAA